MRGVIVALALAIPGGAMAHPHNFTDQQVQLSVGLAAVHVRIFVMPSPKDGPVIFSHIDTDDDGVVTNAEAKAFGADVLAATELTVDERGFAFTNVEVTLPSAREAENGSAAIIVQASTPISWARQQSHSLQFSITYGALSHSWFIQPFFHPDLFRASVPPTVDRATSEGMVVVRFDNLVTE
ncbi:DUF1007 family protein [Rhizobium leguminosarum]|uniref:DUF1007 family protein n=1 Tax=Rhizobium leguminosarum TaxID=384 RepID=UPI001C9437D1|nr:DUF1007 family protein [Rhizobium leguminosarum]MBY5827571.1 DUF1007 family protein [Rhizobium leguminosarum]